MKIEVGDRVRLAEHDHMRAELEGVGEVVGLRAGLAYVECDVDVAGDGIMGAVWFAHRCIKATIDPYPQPGDRVRHVNHVSDESKVHGTADVVDVVRYGSEPTQVVVEGDDMKHLWQKGDRRPGQSQWSLTNTVVIRSRG